MFYFIKILNKFFEKIYLSFSRYFFKMNFLRCKMDLKIKNYKENYRNK